MIETTELYILISAWMTLTFIEGHREIKTFVHFLWNFTGDLDETGCFATTCWFVEAHAKFFYGTIKIHGREICWHYFRKHCHVSWHLWTSLFQTLCDAGHNWTYSFILLWMTLKLTQGYRVMEKVELVQSFCCKVALNNSKVNDSWLSKGDDCEEFL